MLVWELPKLLSLVWVLVLGVGVRATLWTGLRGATADSHPGLLEPLLKNAELLKNADTSERSEKIVVSGKTGVSRSVSYDRVRSSDPPMAQLTSRIYSWFRGASLKSNLKQRSPLKFYQDSSDFVAQGSSNKILKQLAKNLGELNLGSYHHASSRDVPLEQFGAGMRFLAQSIQLLNSDALKNQHEWLWVHGAVQEVSSLLRAPARPIFQSKLPKAALEVTLLKGETYHLMLS